MYHGEKSCSLKLLCSASSQACNYSYKKFLTSFGKESVQLEKNEQFSTIVRLNFNQIPNLGPKKGLSPNGF